MRKIKRDILKNQIGSNRIGHTWRSRQIKKYGRSFWLAMYRACVGKLAKNEIYY